MPTHLQWVLPMEQDTVHRTTVSLSMSEKAFRLSNAQQDRIWSLQHVDHQSVRTRTLIFCPVQWVLTVVLDVNHHYESGQPFNS